MEVCAVFFSNSGLGLARYSPSRIQCSDFPALCYLNYQKIRSVLRNSRKVLTNAAQHEIFVGLQATQAAPQAYEQQGIAALIARLKKGGRRGFSISQMAEFQLKYQALGILLGYLFDHTNERNQILATTLVYEDIDFFIDTLFHHVFVTSADTWFLELKKEEVHPSLVKGKGASKEGFSVLNMYESYMVSNGGKRVLRSIYANPTYDREELEGRLDIFQWMGRHFTSKQHATIFRHMHSLENILKKFNKAAQDEQDWRKTMKTLSSMISLRKALSTPSLPSLLTQFVEDHAWPGVIKLHSLLHSTLELNPLAIKTNINQELDELKKTYEDLSNLLTVYAEQHRHELQGQTDFRIMFLAQVGYLLRIDHEVELKQVGEQWHLQFVNNLGRYYSNSFTVRLDETYGDIYGEIQDTERRMLMGLASEVMTLKEDLLRLFWKTCEIEFYWAVTQMSSHMCRPKLSSEGLLIRNGWHLLLASSAVDNHSFSFPHHSPRAPQVYNSEANIVNSNYANRMVVLSGCNGSGKTVYMKQVGIIVYLAHLGFFLPAEAAEIPLIDRLAVVVGDNSLYQACGFKGELRSLASALNADMTTSHSMILIDELGGQIDYQFALKILFATAKTLTRPSFHPNPLLKTADDEFKTPLSIVVTHLTEILKKNLVEETYLLRYLSMSTTKEGDFFKLLPGLVRKGYGIKASEEFMDKAFIDSAIKHWRALQEEN